MALLDEIRDNFKSLSPEQKTIKLKSMTAKEKLFFLRNPDIFLFDKQIIPDGDWRYYLLQCGRSFGKTYTGAEIGRASCRERV